MSSGLEKSWRGCGVLLICLLAWTPFGATVRAQSSRTGEARPGENVTALRKFEVGLNLADIRTDCINSAEQCGLPQFGIGFGASYNLNAHFAIDGNFAVTPTSSRSATNIYGGRHAEYLVGLRAEARARHYGYFLKTQVGMLSWNHVITQAVFPRPGQFYFLYGDQRKFAGNVAAGFEYSPSPRIRFRSDFGDLLRAYTWSSWSNNLQSTAGVYLGLGKTSAWSAPGFDAKATHRFFDGTNDTLIASSVLAITADSITTQRFISRGQVEKDPFARPLVKYGWSGQIAAEGLEINALIWGMYGLHRIHQHWAERIAPASVSMAHGFLAYENDRATANPKAAP